MTEQHAFKATFSDFRIIKSRKVGVLLFEIPIELADEALRVLGGVPRPDLTAWVGIARIHGEEAVGEVVARERRRFADLSPAQQASLLCRDMEFRQFLRESGYPKVGTETDAATVVRFICGDQSRADLNFGEPATKWEQLMTFFTAHRKGIPYGQPVHSDAQPFGEDDGCPQGAHERRA